MENAIHQTKHKTLAPPKEKIRLFFYKEHDRIKGAFSIRSNRWRCVFTDKYGGKNELFNLYQNGIINHEVWVEYSQKIHHSSLPSEGNGQVSVYKDGKLISYYCN